MTYKCKNCGSTEMNVTFQADYIGEIDITNVNAVVNNSTVTLLQGVRCAKCGADAEFEDDDM